MRGRVLPAAGTALLAGTVVLRIVRTAGSLESVLGFYTGGAGPFWALVKLALFLGPYLAAAAAAAALWLPPRRAEGLGTAALCANACFVFAEGLTAFARAMNGHGGYAGAEPLFSAFACGISAGSILRARRAERNQN